MCIIPTRADHETDVMLDIYRAQHLVAGEMLRDAHSLLQKHLNQLRSEEQPPLSSGYHRLLRIQAEVYLKTGQMDRCLAEAETCLQYLDSLVDGDLHQERRDVLRLLAHVYEAQGRFDDALDALRLARQLHDEQASHDAVDNLEVWAHEARLLKEMGREQRFILADEQVKDAAASISERYARRQLPFDAYERSAEAFARYLAATNQPQAEQTWIELRDRLHLIPSPTAEELLRQMNIELRLAEIYKLQARPLDQLKRLNSALRLSREISDEMRRFHADRKSPDHLGMVEDLLRDADLHRRLSLAMAYAATIPDVAKIIQQRSKEDIGTLARKQLLQSRQLYQAAWEQLEVYQAAWGQLEGVSRRTARVNALRMTAAEGSQFVAIRQIQQASRHSKAGLLENAIDTSKLLLRLRAELLLPNDLRTYDAKLALGRLYVVKGDLESAVECLDQLPAFYSEHGLPDKAVRALTAIARVDRLRGASELAQRKLEQAKEICREHDLDSTRVHIGLRTIAVDNQDLTDAIQEQHALIRNGVDLAPCQAMANQLDLIELLLAKQMQQGRDSSLARSTEKQRSLTEFGTALERAENEFSEKRCEEAALLQKLRHQRAMFHFIKNALEPSKSDREAARRIWLDLCQQLEPGPELARSLYYLARLRYLDWDIEYQEWRARVRQSNLRRTVSYDQRRQAYERRRNKLKVAVSKYLEDRLESRSESEQRKLQAERDDLNKLKLELDEAFRQEELSLNGLDDSLERREVDRMQDEAIMLARQAVTVLDGLDQTQVNPKLSYSARCSYAELMMTALVTRKKQLFLAAIEQQLKRAAEIAEEAGDSTHVRLEEELLKAGFNNGDQPDGS